MKKTTVVFLLIFLTVSLVYIFEKYGNFIRLNFPFLKNAVFDVVDQLKVADEFKISRFASNIRNARVIRMDTLGNLWVSQPSAGSISLIEVQGEKASNISPIFTNLNFPHGLAFDPKDPFRLYIAEQDRVSYVQTYSEGELNKIIDLPTGGNHRTRTIGFGPDGMLYTSVGSTCNVCNESDKWRAAILKSDAEGKKIDVYARGLRNAVFFIWNSGKMLATEMGRDFLGDDSPPDELDIIESGKNYGWPTCYGKNIHDTDFDKNTYFRNPCIEPFEIGSFIDIPAHSAPLGLGFIPQNSKWPREYWDDLLVAYHGSWNRSVPTGYKIVRYKFNDKGDYEGVSEDFITGFLKSDGSVIGRPVDILVSPDGYAYVTDDYAGAIYKIEIVK